jgi:hypothetical protein
VAIPVETSSSTLVNSVNSTAFRTEVAPAAVIVEGGTKTERPSSLSSVNAGWSRRLRSKYW